MLRADNYLKVLKVRDEVSIKVEPTLMVPVQIDDHLRSHRKAPLIDELDWAQGWRWERSGGG